jgi:hypothetical protein
LPPHGIFRFGELDGIGINACFDNTPTEGAIPRTSGIIIGIKDNLAPTIKNGNNTFWIEI